MHDLFKSKDARVRAAMAIDITLRPCGDAPCDDLRLVGIEWPQFHRWLLWVKPRSIEIGIASQMLKAKDLFNQLRSPHAWIRIIPEIKQRMAVYGTLHALISVELPFNACRRLRNLINAGISNPAFAVAFDHKTVIVLVRPY